MRAIFAQEPLEWTGPAIFLAGPTLRKRTAPCGNVLHAVDPGNVPCTGCDGSGRTRLSSWREEALGLLATRGGDVTVIVPEFRDWREWTPNDNASWAAQVEWEDRAMSDPRVVLLFWVPRDMKTLPGMTTNVEFGYYLAKRPHAMVVGWPDDAEHVRYFKEKARLGVLSGNTAHLGFHNTLQATCQAALAQIEMLGY